MKIISCLLLACFGLSVANGSATVSSVPGTGSLRAFIADDISRGETIVPLNGRRAEFSPDGRAVAWARTRPSNTSRHLDWASAVPPRWLGADVWVSESGSGHSVKITDGDKDDTTWWHQTWSPDSQHLAMLSNRGDAVGLWIWSRDRRELRRLCPTDIDGARGVSWRDHENILVWKSRSGVITGSSSFSVPRAASMVWDRFRRGEVTANVLSAGAALDDYVARNVADAGDLQLCLVNIITGSTRILSSGFSSDRVVAPNGKSFAVVRWRMKAVPLAKVERVDGFSPVDYTYSLEVVSMDGVRLFKIESTDRPGPFAFGKLDANDFIYSGRRADGKYVLRRVSLASGESVELPLSQLSLDRSTPWLLASDDSVLLKARRESGSDRADWWRLDRGGKLNCLSSGCGKVPQQLHPIPDGRFLGITDEGLSLISDTGICEAIAIPVGPDVAPSMPPELEFPRNGGGQKILVTKHRADGDVEQFWADIADFKFKAITTPEKGAILCDIAWPESQPIALFITDGNAGFSLWQGNRDRFDRLAEGNDFLKAIAPPRWVEVKYRSKNDEALVAWLMLPEPYVEGRKYPVLVKIYPGSVWSETARPDNSEPQGSLDMRVAAGKGYAVLFPSMPAVKEDEEPMANLSDRVAPALDEANARRLVDGDRAFLIGHSAGGYSALGILASDHRYKAAIVCAGVSDLVSDYLTIPANGYSIEPERVSAIMRMWNYESGQGGMGVPPWKDLEKYRRNSPIVHSGEFRTPILFIHGDLDVNVPIEQSTEMFQSLLRQGKTAQFVRYWGEAHSLVSPANVTDMWSRIINWCDKYGGIRRGPDGQIVQSD